MHLKMDRVVWNLINGELWDQD